MLGRLDVQKQDTSILLQDMWLDLIRKQGELEESCFQWQAFDIERTETICKRREQPENIVRPDAQSSLQ